MGVVIRKRIVMKRKAFTTIAFVLAMVGFSACEKEKEGNGSFTFNASIENLSTDDPAAKVHLVDEQWIYWELGDNISIASDQSTSQVVATLTNTGGPNYPDFNGTFISELPWDSKYFVGLFPYSEYNVISKAGGAGNSTGFSAQIDLPSVQPFRTSSAGGHDGDHTFNRNIYPMVALYDGHWDDEPGSVAYNLNFHSLAGIVRLQFYDATGSNDKKIRRVTVTSADKQLCGLFNVQGLYTAQPYLAATNNSSNHTITLDCGEDGRDFDSILSFYLVLPALGNSDVTTRYALSVTLETKGGETCTKNITSVPVRRTGIAYMRALGIDSWTPSVSASQYLVGNGTKERPFKIYTATDLIYLRNCYNADTAVGTPRTINGRPITGHTYIRIMRTDIALTNSNWTTGISNFVGHMTDASNSGSNLPGITNNSSYPLFASIKAAGVVEGITVKSPSLSYAGVGNFSPFCVENYGTLKDCVLSSTSNVVATSGLAGIVVRNRSTGVVEGCHCDGSLSAVGNAVGGVCLQNEGTVTGCFVNTLAVPAAATVGGIVHSNTGTVTDCYFASRITSGSSNWGGIVYENNTTGFIERCYYSSTAVITTSGTAGGIVHDLTNNKINRCRFEGSILAASAAGIAHTVSGGTVINCYVDADTAQLRGDNVAAGLVAYLSSGSIDNSFVHRSSITGTAQSTVLAGVVASVTGGTVVNSYSYQSQTNNFYGTTTLTGSALTAAFVHCYLVDNSQTGITLVTEANTAASSSTTGALVNILNDGTGLPTPLVSRDSWLLRSGSTYPVLNQ